MKRNISADSLRGLAALNVVFAHYIGAFYPDSYFVGNLFDNIKSGEMWPNNMNDVTWAHIIGVIISPILNPFYGGRCAVMIFFVISGYVLTNSYCNTKNLSNLKILIYSRFFRLNIPIGVATLVALILYKNGLFYSNDVSVILKNEWFSLFYKNDVSISELVKLVLYKSLFFGHAQLNPPVWTMKVEFIGSILLLIFYAIRPSNNFMGMILFIVVSSMFVSYDLIYVAFLFAGSYLNYLKFNKKYNVCLFVVGSYLACAQMNSLIYDVLPINSNSEYKLNLYVGIGAVFITASVLNGLFENTLKSRLCKFLGEISFSIYLVHFIILSSLISYLYINFPRSWQYSLLIFTIYISTCVAAAYLFTIYIDRFSIKFSRKLANKFV